MTRKSSGLIGRDSELAQVRACLRARKNVLLEGPVGVGKTRLAIAVTQELGLPVFRVDGDSRYSEQKLTGWFDPPSVIQKGYSKETFIPGPLVEAMRQGGVLFINELNRLPEGVQNVLLPAIDERILVVPRLGEVQATSEFLVIATQNPKEFVATSHLSEAILDRFELVVLDYQPEGDELQMVEAHLAQAGEALGKTQKQLALAAVRLVRRTRDHARIRRGASVRAALSIADIAQSLIQLDKKPLRDAFVTAVILALPTRIEIERDAESEESLRVELEGLLKQWSEEILDELDHPQKKK